MAKKQLFKGLTKRLPPGVLMKLLSLIVDAVMLLSITGLDLSKNNKPHSNLAILIVFDVCFVIVAGVLLITKIILARKSTSGSKPKGFTKEDIIYDFFAAVMGLLFLTGDNLTDNICSDLKTPAVDCRKASVSFIGVSTGINLVLLYFEHASESNQGWKGLPMIGKDHKRWAKTLNLLTLTLIFDQTITGLHESVFKLTRNETLLCPTGTHVSGALVYCCIAFIWLLLLVSHGRQFFPKGLKSRCLFCLTLLCMWLYFAMYIFADTPWPWECFAVDKGVMRGGLMARLVLLCIALLFIVTFFILYSVIVCVPSLCVIKNVELALDNSGVEEIFRDIPVQKAISFEKAKNLSVAPKFKEDMIEASYTVSFSRDYDWRSALKWKSKYVAEEGGDTADERKTFCAETSLKLAAREEEELVYNFQTEQVEVLKKKDDRNSDVPPGCIIFGENSYDATIVIVPKSKKQ